MKRLLFSLLFIPVIVIGQDKTKLFDNWSTIASVGITVGRSGSMPVCQLSGGINYKRFFTGVGVGYDNYQFRTIPVFADWRWRFGKEQSGFIYGIGGYNFPVKNDEIFEWSKTYDDLKPAFYFDLGVGGGVRIRKSNRLSISAGFTRKEMRQRKIFVYPCITGDCPEEVYRLKYSFGRLTTKISFEF